MIKNPLTYGLIAATLLLSSCSANVVFEDPMPRHAELQKDIPTQFHGTWMDENDERWIVESAGILKDGELLKNDAKTQIRTEDDHMFINFRDDKGWELYVTQVDGNTMDVYTIELSDDRLFKKLNRLTDLEVTYGEDGSRTLIKLNPTNREFRKMVRRKMFSYQGSLSRI